MFSVPQDELDTLNQSGAAVNQLETEYSVRYSFAALTLWFIYSSLCLLLVSYT